MIISRPNPIFWKITLTFGTHTPSPPTRLFLDVHRLSRLHLQPHHHHEAISNEDSALGWRIASRSDRSGRSASHSHRHPRFRSRVWHQTRASSTRALCRGASGRSQIFDNVRTCHSGTVYEIASANIRWFFAQIFCLLLSYRALPEHHPSNRRSKPLSHSPIETALRTDWSGGILVRLGWSSRLLDFMRASKWLGTLGS